MRRVVRDAAILLTLAAAVLGAVACAGKGAVPMAISRVAIFALLLNAIGHCAVSLKRHTVSPGTGSAVALVLPFSAIAILAMRTELGDSSGTLLRYAALGAFVAPLAIFAFLWISYGLTRATGCN